MCNPLIIWTAILSISLLFGSIHYKAGYYADLDKHNNYFKFLEFFRCFANYFISSTIVYYFVWVRGVTAIEPFSFGDGVLGVVLLIGIFGWLPYFVKNITEGINAILSRILNK